MVSLGTRRQRSEAVAVVIPTRDRWPFLRIALAGALAQNDVDVHVVVVDDASVDATARELGALDDARIRVLRHDRPKGVSAARNLGLEHVAAPGCVPRRRRRVGCRLSDRHARRDASVGARQSARRTRLQRTPSGGLPAATDGRLTGPDAGGGPPRPEQVQLRRLSLASGAAHGSRARSRRLGRAPIDRRRLGSVGAGPGGISGRAVSGTARRLHGPRWQHAPGCRPILGRACGDPGQVRVEPAACPRLGGRNSFAPWRHAAYVAVAYRARGRRVRAARWYLRSFRMHIGRNAQIGASCLSEVADGADAGRMVAMGSTITTRQCRCRRHS